MGNHPSLHGEDEQIPSINTHPKPILPHKPLQPIQREPSAIYVEKQYTNPHAPNPIQNYYRLNTQQYIPAPEPVQEKTKPTKVDKYRQYSGLKSAERQVLNMNDIEVDLIDPFGLLQHSPHMTLVDLTKTYITLRNIHHPDKGGEQEKFIQIMNAIKTIQWIDKATQSDKTYLDLKKNFTEGEHNKKPLDKDELPEQLRHMSTNKFNQMFEENRFREEEEDGYGRYMEESNGKREDIEVPRVISQYKKKEFNSEFAKIKQSIRKKDELVRYQVPESLTSGNLGYIVLGDKKEKKYTGSAGSLQYTDYMDAYTKDNVLVNDSELPKHIKKRINERDLGKAVRDYKRSSTELTEEQQLAIEEREEMEKKMELERQRRFKETERKYAEYENQIQKRIGYKWSDK